MKIVHLVFWCLVASASFCAAADDPGAVAVPNPLTASRTGDWALYKLNNGFWEKNSIIARKGESDDADVTIRSEMIRNDAVVSSEDRTRRAGDFYLLKKTGPNRLYQITDAKSVNIKGKEIRVVVLKMLDHADATKVWDEIWLSGDVPGNGRVRHVTNGVLQAELDDFGKAQ